jgi:hypothetical protein
MPVGIPTAQQLVNGEVTFFSLDTDVIQAAAYNFGKGALNQLPKQLPAAMKLQLTPIVFHEIVDHRMSSVKEAAEQFTSATAKLTRLTAFDFAPAEAHFQELDVVAAAKQKFEGEVRQYVGQCRGAVLHLADVDSELLFRRYFAAEPPFGVKASKKSEFPDAAALLLLEKHAADTGTKGILASQDAAWRNYAEQSEHLYCVPSLDELAALFAASGAHAQAVKDKISAAVHDEDSALRSRLTEALRSHVANADWSADELWNASQRIEAEVYGAELASYVLEEDSLNVWQVDEEPTTWVVELNASVQVDVEVSVQFYVWDSIDREELAIGGQSHTFSEKIEVEAYLTCSAVEIDAAPETWDIDIEIGSGKYALEDYEVELDLGGDE